MLAKPDLAQKRMYDMLNTRKANAGSGVADLAEKTEYPYLDMYCSDESGISVEHWCESWSVGMHRHAYYELMVVSRGSCRHIFQGVETLLIPGDAVIVPGHAAHGYALRGQISLYNCQFTPERLDARIQKKLPLAGLAARGDEQTDTDLTRPQEQLTQREQMHAAALPNYEANSSKQGVLHLSPVESTFVVSLMQHVLAAQQEGGEQGALMKQKYMEIILLELSRALAHQNQKYQVCSTANQKIIAQVLVEIEGNLTEPFDIEATARRYAFSPNYFRKLFKDITGLTPIQYLNRMRIIQACECIETQGMSIKEAAECVGLYDLNYFTRLFKKIVGCPPNKL